MVTLDLQDAVFQGAARTAPAFQVAEQGAQSFIVERHPADQGDRLALAPLGFPLHAYHAIPLWASRFFTATLRDRFSAPGAHPAPFGRIDRGIYLFFSH